VHPSVANLQVQLLERRRLDGWLGGTAGASGGDGRDRRAKR
jgi:hypothetical protein